MKTSLRLLRLGVVALCASGCDYGLSLGPIWGPGGGGGGGGGGWPNLPPGYFFSISSSERAVQVGDTLLLAATDASSAVWSSSDTTVATVEGLYNEGRIVGRAAGSVVISVAAHGRTLTRRIDVVPSLCQQRDASRSIGLGGDTVLTLDADDCAIGFDEDLQWPLGADGPAHPSLRAEVVGVEFSDSTMLRLDASSATLNPLVALADSQRNLIAGRLNGWGDVYLARLVPPGRYSVWLGSDAHRPTGDIRLQVRSVARCRTASPAASALAIGTWHTDTLDASSCHSDRGEMQAPWQFVVPSSGYYRIMIETTLPNPSIQPFVLYDGFAISFMSRWWEVGTHTVQATNAVDGPYRIRIVACSNIENCPP